jgi:hypothetical protein
MGVGVVGLGLGVGFGLWANSTANQMNSTFDPTQKPSLKSDAQTRATLANVSYAVGGALLAGGLAVRLFWPEASSSGSSTSVAVSLSTNGVIVGGAF